ncbi:glutaminase [Microbacterium sp.]|uniref:glutaminase n=1 Tax=Microbacterium sp. TaxID=51671 RepID=UPI003F9B9590
MKSTAEVLAAARSALAGIPKEGLGEERSSRWRGARIVLVGAAWHIGVLLIADDRVFATGEVLRAVDPGRRGYAAESARERAARRQMALKGGFSEGEVVHVGWSVIDVDAVDAGGSSGPLLLQGRVPMVRWSGSSYRPLDAYVQEQIELLLGC